MNIDSTIQAWTQWDPFSPSGFNTARAIPQWSGETKFLKTNMMGSTALPTRFEALKVQSFNAGGEVWKSQFSGDNMAGIGPGGSRYGFAWIFADSFKIWTFGT